MLTLIIPPDWPQHRRDCPWLLDPGDGQPLRHGCGEPATWPGAGEAGPRPCRLLLAGHQVAVHPARLPPGPGGRRPAVVGAALEETLLEAPEQLAFALGPTDAGSTAVGVVAHARLAALVGLLRELGWSPQAAWPLALALATPAAWLCGDSVDLPGIALPIDTPLADWPWPANAAPLPVHVLDADVERDRRLAAELGTDHPQLTIGGPPPALQLPPGPGFLDGELAPPRPPGILARHARPALRLAGFLGAAVIALGAGQWLWQAWQIRELRQQIASEFRAVLPGVPLVDPARQLAQAVGAARRGAGLLADDDFLMLAATLGELPETARVQALSYENGRLSGSLTLPDEALPMLAAAAARRGQHWQASAGGGRSEFTLSGATP